eukprot:Tamp_13404.p1 GENE.Tamp_13404~~Tamp_13404.p1  ORF type:complete len:555 (-),score=77.21 Tamp_13404:59-1702(-)
MEGPGAPCAGLERHCSGISAAQQRPARRPAPQRGGSRGCLRDCRWTLSVAVVAGLSMVMVPGGRADLLETLVQPGLPQLQLRGSSAPPACPGGLLSASGSPSGGGSNSGPALASPVQVRTGLPLWEPGFAGAELDAQHPGGSAGKDLRQYEDLVLKGVSSALPKRRGDKRDVSGSPSQVPSARSRSSPSAKAASTPREPASPRSRESATHAPGAENAAGQDPAEGWRLELDCAWSSIPHPLKVHRGGEDVHIVCRAGGSTLIGVFDGVGGWAEVGVDPADYARRLGYMIEVQLRGDPGGATRLERPLLVWLQRAVDKLDREEMPGSCTACLALLTHEGLLHVLNLGDSGLHLIRNGVSVFQTNEQQHYFNCPFQLGMGSDDSPLDADYYIIDDLRHGDLLVAGTDGVWDNVYEEELLSLVADDMSSAPRLAEREGDAQGLEVWPLEPLARAISRTSHLRARDTEYASPFATNAEKEGLKYSGGKLDDITVVVSRLCRVPKTEDDDATPPHSGIKRGAARGGADAGETVRASASSEGEWDTSTMSQTE